MISSVSIAVSPQRDDYAPGETITLTATAEPPRAGLAWSWRRTAGATPADDAAWVPLTSDSATVTVPVEEGIWTYSAHPKDTDAAQSGTTVITVVAPTGAGQDPQDKPPALTFRPRFAGVVALLLVILLVAFVWSADLFSLSVVLGDKAAEADPRAALAAKVIGPVLAVSALLLLAGLWMLLVEWRGAFAKPAGGDDEVVTRGIPDVAELVKALGDLKGATLVFVGGLVSLFLVAWMVGATSSSTGGSGDGGTTDDSSTTSSAPG